MNLIDRGRNVINQQIINLFDSQRENFATGWPELGIPPLDPFYIEEYDANLDTIGTLSS